MNKPLPLTLGAINALDRDAFVDALGGTFEHSPWVAEVAWQARPFDSVARLHAAMVAAVEAAPHATRLALLRSHPALAGREAQAGTMTDASTDEQSRAGLTALTSAEAARIAQLNAAYGARHGFPFIACVAHYTKAGILFEMQRRLDNDSDTELRNALAQIFAITRLRLERSIDDRGPARAVPQAA